MALILWKDVKTELVLLSLHFFYQYNTFFQKVNIFSTRTYVFYLKKVTPTGVVIVFL